MLFWRSHSSSLCAWLKGLWFKSWLGTIQQASLVLDHVFPTLLFHAHFEMILRPYSFSQLIHTNFCVALHVRLLLCTWLPSVQHEWKQEMVVWSLDRCVYVCTCASKILLSAGCFCSNLNFILRCLWNPVYWFTLSKIATNPFNFLTVAFIQI